MIKFVNDLRHVGGFLRVLRFPPPNKTDRHDITEILLKVALNTIKKKQNQTNPYGHDRMTVGFMTTYDSRFFILINQCITMVQR